MESRLRELAPAEGTALLVRVWQYDVRPGHEAEFERLYGASGAWAQLFARSSDYLGTELFRAVQRPRRYVTVDRFSSEEAWHGFLSEHRTAYTELDSHCAELTDAEVDLLG